MLLVIVEKAKKTDVCGLPCGTELLVSHGIDINTNKLVILPNVPPHEIGCFFDNNIGEYVMESW